MTLVPVDVTNEVAVTSYLQQARDWLTRAVDETGPEQIAAAKAEIATAAEATKQLGLSKEIQEDAAEMVRRAEYAIGKAMRRGQAEGTIRTSADNLTPGRGNPLNEVHVGAVRNPAPADFIPGRVERADSLDMADAGDEAFEAALSEARAEGNLSRANVARKAREKSGAQPTPAQRRKPLTDAARDAGWDLRKAVERLQRITADDRFASNKQQVAPQMRSHLENAVEVCQDLLARIDN